MLFPRSFATLLQIIHKTPHATYLEINALTRERVNEQEESKEDSSKQAVSAWQLETVVFHQGNGSEEVLQLKPTPSVASGQDL